MKSLVTFAVLALAFSANAQTIQARSGLDFSRGQSLDVVKINNQIDSKKVAVVRVVANPNAPWDGHPKNIKVEIYNDICGSMRPNPNHEVRCLAMAALDQVIEIPVVEETTDCGSKVYVGSEDKTPVDGARIALTVYDHSTRMCRDLTEGQVVVEGSMFNPWVASTTTYKFIQSHQVIVSEEQQGIDLSAKQTLSKVILNGVEQARRYKGSVSVNKAGKVVNVEYSYNPCAGRACLAIEAIRSLSLKLVSVVRDSCGTTVYKASTDLRKSPVGGEYSQITVRDHSTRFCEDYLPSTLVVEGQISSAYHHSQPTRFVLMK